MKKLARWFKQLKRPEKILLVIGMVLVLSGVGGALSGNQPQSKPNPASTQTAPKPPKITTKTVTETQSIAFGSKTVQSSSLAKGKSEITTKGVNGQETLTYKVTYEDGVQTDRQLIKTKVTKQPVTQITTIGTYVAPAPAPAQSCPNGTYVNSSGNTVCSPYASSSAPAGATAKCRDGTYSFSQHHSGTCSYHGGVAEWL